jgi:hypothetical protein
MKKSISAKKRMKCRACFTLWSGIQHPGSDLCKSSLGPQFWDAAMNHEHRINKNNTQYVKGPVLEHTSHTELLFIDWQHDKSDQVTFVHGLTAIFALSASSASGSGQMFSNCFACGPTVALN